MLQCGSHELVREIEPARTGLLSIAMNHLDIKDLLYFAYIATALTVVLIIML
jgi:hypothetical protein